jgi:uncharacterized protein (UPF0218 family)
MEPPIPERNLKELYRRRLKEPLGKIYPDMNSALKQIDVKGKLVISVGDVVTKNLLQKGISPKLSIVDYKVERKPVDHTYDSAGFNLVLTAINPPGKITSDAWKQVERGLKRGKVLLEIDGEEDLLVLPVLAMARKGSVVFYGQPEDGVVAIPVDDAVKGYAKTLLNACFEAE